MKQEKNSELRQRGLLSLLLLFLALVGITTATVAWFTIADHTRLNSISMNVTSGVSMRFDLDPHSEFMDYTKTLSFEQIAQRIQRDKGYSMADTPMEPVTTSDGITFTFRDGTVANVNSGVYLEFTLHFMAEKDMVVHLTSSDGAGGAAGTSITSDVPGLPESMRISFTAEGKTYIFDPGLGDNGEIFATGKIFGLPSAANMVYNNINALFPLQEGVDQPVLVRIWLEGTDEACTNALRGSNYALTLRFEGTTQDNKLFTDA
jgi:hypothetical protein